MDHAIDNETTSITAALLERLREHAGTWGLLPLLNAYEATATWSKRRELGAHKIEAALSAHLETQGDLPGGLTIEEAARLALGALEDLADDIRIEYIQLTPHAQEHAFLNWREAQFCGNYWAEYVTEDAKNVAEVLGLAITEVYWDLDSSHRMCVIEGSYSYKAGSAKAVREYAPQDAELHKIADALRDAQRRCFYDAIVRLDSGYANYGKRQRFDSVSHSGRALPEDAVESIQEALLDFSSWFFSRLRVEYDYLDSEQALLDSGQSFNWYGDAY